MKWLLGLAAVGLFVLAGYSVLHDHQTSDRTVTRAEERAAAAEVRAARAEALAAANQAAIDALTVQVRQLGGQPVSDTPTTTPPTTPATTPTTASPPCLLGILCVP